MNRYLKLETTEIDMYRMYQILGYHRLSDVILGFSYFRGYLVNRCVIY